MGIGDRLELWNRAELQGHLRELVANRAKVQRAGQAVFDAFADFPPLPPRREC